MKKVILVLALVSCDNVVKDTNSTTQTDPDIWSLQDLNGACDSSEKVGGFELAQWDSDTEGYSTVTGQINNAVNPIGVLFEKTVVGDCVLYQKVNPFCEEACDSTEVCTHDGECVESPSSVDLGKVTISGLGSTLSMEPDQFNNYWDTSVSYPLFDEGAQIKLISENGLSLRGIGVEKLEVANLEWEIVYGEDLNIEWTAGSDNGRIYASFNIDQHGNSPATIICETEDIGNLTVPSSLLEELVEYGVSGYANGIFRRRSVDSMQVDGGCAELQVYSNVHPYLSLEGHIPCNNDTDCPETMHCDVPNNTCVED